MGRAPFQVLLTVLPRDEEKIKNIHINQVLLTDSPREHAEKMKQIFNK